MKKNSQFTSIMSSPFADDQQKMVLKATDTPKDKKRNVNNNTAYWRNKKLEYDLKKLSKYPKYFSLPPYIYKYNYEDQLKQNESTLWTTSTSKAAKLVTDKQAP